MTITLGHFLSVAGALFALGIYTVLTRKNAVGILMGVELMLNGAHLNLVAFCHYNPDVLITGQVFALFSIVMAAAGAAVALAIVLALFLTHRSIDVTEAQALKG